MTAPGSNRNMLIELNIERTRHNEIQLIGNGDVVRLARRPRLLAADARAEAGRGLDHPGAARGRGRARRAARRARSCAATSARSRAWRPRPSASARRPGSTRRRPSSASSKASALLHGDEHAHPGRAPRVRAGLRAALHQPGRSLRELRRRDAGRGDGLLAQHGRRVPRPERVPRSLSGLEVRINATNARSSRTPAA